MIRRSTAVAAAAILLSLLVHAFGLTFSTRGAQEPAIEENVTDTVALGNAFEDVAEAATEPVEPEPAKAPEPPVETPPEPPVSEAPTSEALVASSDPQQVRAPGLETATAVQPETKDAVEPAEGEVTQSKPVDPPENSVEPEPTAPVEPDAAAEAPEGDPEAGAEAVAALSAEPEVTSPVAPAPVPAAIPVVPLESDPVVTADPDATVEPVPEDPNTTEPKSEEETTELALRSSPRPQLPGRRPSAEPAGVSGGSGDLSHLRPDDSQLVESPLTLYQRDGVDLTVRQGQGGRTGALGFAGVRGSGNSDTTNYAGQVLMHLNRTQPVHVTGRGFANVSFEINPDGTLAWVDIVDSSGSEKINRAAKQQVRAGVPFPRPPDGKSRKLAFVYQID